MDGLPDDRFVYQRSADTPAVIASDASEHAICSYDVQNAGGFFHQDILSISEASYSSGHRELLAVLSTLRSSSSTASLSSRSCYWLTDSENLVTFLAKGSSKLAIQSTVLDIFRLAHRMKLDLIPLHVRRSDYRIQAADHGSRFYDPDDWSIDTASFESITQFWPASIDLFAHFSNSHLPRFYSFGNAPHTSIYFEL